MDVSATALKSLADEAKGARQKAADSERERKAMFIEQAGFVDNVRRGNIHDGRLDCVAGNGIIGELGMGLEPEPESLAQTRASEESTSRSSENMARKEEQGAIGQPSHVVLPSSSRREYSQIYGPTTLARAYEATRTPEESEQQGKSSTADIDQIPVVIIKGFDEKDGGSKGNEVLYNGMADWAAALVENKVRHQFSCRGSRYIFSS